MFEIVQPWLPIILFVFGALMGSFANVIIYRWPEGESVIHPASHCRACGHPLRWFDNIPLLAWFWLRGRCRHCGAPYSIRYVVVELLMATFFPLVFLFVGWSPSLIEYLIFVFGLVTVSFIDLDHFLLPDVFTLSGIVIGLIGAALNPERHFWEALAGVLLGGGFLWAVAAIYYALRKEEGMGGGDIKLLAWIGAILGWKAVPFVIISASLIGTVFGLVLAVRSKKGLKTVIPFGPYLAVSALLYILGGESLGTWYLGLFLPAFVN